MEMFAKTKMCRFFILGKCAKGLQCPYAHDKRELRDIPDLRCTKICNTLLQTGECNDKSCAYAHNHKELRSTAFQKTKLCRNLQFGRCPRGDKCNFAHSTTDIQSPTSMQALKMLPPGLGGYDGDDQSTQVDSNSSDHGSVTASVNPMLEPAYIHIGAPPNKMELGHQRAFKKPMTNLFEKAPHKLGNMELSHQRAFKQQMTKQMERAPHNLEDMELGHQRAFKQPMTNLLERAPHKPGDMELGHQRAFKQQMTKQMERAPHNLEDMDLGHQRAFKQPMTKQMEMAPNNLGDIIRLSDYTIEPMQSRMNLPANADFSLRDYLNAIDQLVQENARRPYPVLSV